MTNFTTMVFKECDGVIGIVLRPLWQNEKMIKLTKVLSNGKKTLTKEIMLLI